jgi:hypothetical protein
MARYDGSWLSVLTLLLVAVPILKELLLNVAVLGLISRLVGFQLATFDEKILVRKLLTELTKGYITLEQDGEPSGLIFGWWWVAYVFKTMPSRGPIIKTVWLFSSKSIRDRLCGETKTSSGRGVLKSWQRNGDLGNMKYLPTICLTTEMEGFITRLRPSQQEALDYTKKLYKKKKHAVIMLYGESNSGKSCLGPILAYQLEGTLCTSFNPTVPVDTFSNLYITANPTEKCPLVVIFEEFDTLLEVIKNKTYPTSDLGLNFMTSKSDWNTFFDTISHELYSQFPNVIFVLTSNLTPEQIRTKMDDESYIRKGRVDRIFEIKKD